MLISIYFVYFMKLNVYTRNAVEKQSSVVLENNVDVACAKMYLSPSVLRSMNEDTMRQSIPIIDYINWGLHSYKER